MHRAVITAALALVGFAEAFSPGFGGGLALLDGGGRGAHGRGLCPQAVTGRARAGPLLFERSKRGGLVGARTMNAMSMSGVEGRESERGVRGTPEDAPVKLEGKSVGIDLGTSNSAVAAMIDGKPTIIPNSKGGRTTPSVVAYVSDGEAVEGEVVKVKVIVGEDALIMDGEKNVFSSVKRVIGRTFDEARKIATGSLHRALMDQFGEDVLLRAPILKVALLRKIQVTLHRVPPS